MRIAVSKGLVVLLLVSLSLGFLAGPGETQSLRSDRRSADLLTTQEELIEQQMQSSVRSGRETPVSLAGPIDPVMYRLGPGDEMVLEYTGAADRSRNLIVDGEGRLRVPNLGIIAVGGRTLEDVRGQILRDLQPFIPGATIDLRLIRPRAFKVFVVGAVNDAGVVEVRGSARVLEALDAVGGLREKASTRNIRVLRRDGEEVIADLQLFLRTGLWDANPYLHDGDRVIVPPITQAVQILGEVPQPGPFEYKPDDTLTRLLEMAGGTYSRSRLDSVLVIRFGELRSLDTLVVDLQAILDGTAADVPIMEDDRIFVRSKIDWHLSHQVTVMGEVLYPGTYVIREKEDRVSDLINWADGFTPNAYRKGVRLLRPTEIEGQDVEFERLSRLTRAEMTDTEYQTFRGKLAIRQATYLIDFSSGVPQPPETDVLLRNNDLIDVERVEFSVRIDGNISRPGFVAYTEGITVGEYIEMAGGISARADVGKTRITRAGSNESQLAQSSWVVEPGDFIWVPEKKDTSFWDTFKDVIAVAGQMAAIILLLDTLSRN